MYIFFIILLGIICSNIKSSLSIILENNNNITNENLIRQRKATATQSSPKPTSIIGLPTKQPAPAFTFTIWDDSGLICIMAKFEATFIITYDVQGGTQQLNDRIPADATSKGRCDYLLDEKPVLDVSWIGGFTFRIIFEKVGESDWGVNSIDLLYNTADSLFRGSAKGGKKVARSAEGSLGMFTTPLGKSYLCPSPPVINLFESKSGRQSVVLRLANIQLQAFQIEKGKFAPSIRCSNVGFGSGVQAPISISFEQDDSVPVIVGSITIMVSILVVIGYAVYRSWFVRRVDYDTMT
jgi:hypothetical protein